MTPTQWLEGLIRGLGTNPYLDHKDIDHEEVMPRLLGELRMYRSMGYGGHELGLFRDPEGHIEVLPLSMAKDIRSNYIEENEDEY